MSTETTAARFARSCVKGKCVRACGGGGPKVRGKRHEGRDQAVGSRLFKHDSDRRAQKRGGAEEFGDVVLALISRETN